MGSSRSRVTVGIPLLGTRHIGRGKGLEGET